MTELYNCKDSGDQYRITKFDEDMNPLHSYLTTLTECDCPAGQRETCRHRQMLVHFLDRKRVNAPWFWDHERSGWVHTDLNGPEPVALPLPLPEPAPQPRLNIRRRV